MTDPFRKPLRIYDTPANNVKLKQEPTMNAPTQETSTPPAQTQARHDKLQALAEYAMTQEKAPAANLTQIAAEILSGLLASGDYTETTVSDSATGYPVGKIRVLPEIVPVAIELARQLMAETQSSGGK
jgi:hypothetical protein